MKNFAPVTLRTCDECMPVNLINARWREILASPVYARWPNGYCICLMYRWLAFDPERWRCWACLLKSWLTSLHQNMNWYNLERGGLDGVCLARDHFSKKFPTPQGLVPPLRKPGSVSGICCPILVYWLHVNLTPSFQSDIPWLFLTIPKPEQCSDYWVIFILMPPLPQGLLVMAQLSSKHSFSFHYLPKSQYCCIHCSFSVNECQWLVYTHTFPFSQTWYYLMIPNMYHISLTLCPSYKYRVKD